MCGFTEPQALTGIDEMYPHIVEVMGKYKFIQHLCLQTSTPAIVFLIFLNRSLFSAI